MKLQSALAIALSASSALALSIPREEADASTEAPEQLFTLELAPGETKQVTEAEKWELHNVSRARQGSLFLTDTFRLASTSWTLQITLSFTSRLNP